MPVTIFSILNVRICNLYWNELIQLINLYLQISHKENNSYIYILFLLSLKIYKIQVNKSIKILYTFSDGNKTCNNSLLRMCRLSLEIQTPHSFKYLLLSVIPWLIKVSKGYNLRKNNVHTIFKCRYRLAHHAIIIKLIQYWYSCEFDYAWVSCIFVATNFQNYIIWDDNYDKIFFFFI